MIREYTSYVSARCAYASGKGKWTVLNCPENAKWTAAISGKAACKDVTKLYLLGALAAMDDFTTRCGVTLVVDDLTAFDLLSQIGEGLRPRIGNLALLNSLEKQFQRHDVTMVYRDHAADPRWSEVLENLKN